jgi:hypothetical protein
MNRRTTHFRRIGVLAATGTLAVMFSSVGCGGGGGSSGAAGAGGHSGGASGAAGTTGTGGATGTAGTTGTGGTTGTAGTTGAAGAAAGTPTAGCQEFVMTLCMRANECNVADGGAVDVAMCASEQAVAFGCDRATLSFATCLSDVKGLSCAGLFPSTGLQEPGSCIDATKDIPLSAAQTACGGIIEVLCDPIDVCKNVMPTDQAFNDCVNQAFVDNDCQFAVSTGTTVTQCVNDLCAQAADAGTNVPDGGLAFPTSCNTAINFAP